ncbi:hypothetical protein HY256_04900 [Candidatus Sumerlaeota bacterium]|nr:hypothetical protein [Candidatus Sumerlaeota bacterium]
MVYPTMLMQSGQAPSQEQRQVLLNLKCLFWCLHEMRQHYNLNLALHSIERRVVHPDLANSHLGDILEFLLHTFSEDELERIQASLILMSESKSAVDVDDKHFEIGHYVQAVDDFGPIAEGAYGIICSVTPQLRGLFYLEEGHLMESAFAPSDARVIFGTYIL